MTRPTLRQALDRIRLVERRAKGLEPGDDVLSRLRLDRLATAPGRWLAVTAAKVAVLAVLATLLAGLFAGGIALMRAAGLER